MPKSASNTLPQPDNKVALRSLQAMLRERTVLAGIEVFAESLGDIFQLSLPGFNAVMLLGPEAARFVLVSGRDDLRWRTESDPVTRLLRQGVLVVDGEEHDVLRRAMNPALHKNMLEGYSETMIRCTDAILNTWEGRDQVDMLVEMRRIALLILTETLFGVDFQPDLDRLWKAILKTLKYISPGLWLVWKRAPRLGYGAALRQVDDYLHRIIRARRADTADRHDLLSHLVRTSGLSDAVIRDQLLTMLIAGHDTSTALLSWALYLLGQHPDAYQQAQSEVDSVLGGQIPGMAHLADLRYLDRLIDETMRLYPPIHLGSRVAARDLEFQGYTIPKDTRVMYSIYLTHRMRAHWADPRAFNPDRFLPTSNRTPYTPYTFLPFGGGPRNCIGAAFAQVEAKIVLARVLQRYALRPQPGAKGARVRPFMGATLEPRPGVWMTLQRR